MGNESLGIDNLVSISIDAIKVTQDVKEALKDGFQPLKDVPAIAFNDFGKLQNISAKAKSAWAEIKDLDPEEIETFEERVADGAGIPNEGVYGKVRVALRLSARVYRVVDECVDIVHDAKELFAEQN